VTHPDVIPIEMDKEKEKEKEKEEKMTVRAVVELRTFSDLRTSLTTEEDRQGGGRTDINTERRMKR